MGFSHIAAGEKRIWILASLSLQNASRGFLIAGFASKLCTITQNVHPKWASCVAVCRIHRSGLLIDLGNVKVTMHCLFSSCFFVVSSMIFIAIYIL